MHLYGVNLLNVWKILFVVLSCCATQNLRAFRVSISHSEKYRPLYSGEVVKTDFKRSFVFFVSLPINAWWTWSHIEIDQNGTRHDSLRSDWPSKTTGLKLKLLKYISKMTFECSQAIWMIILFPSVCSVYECVFVVYNEKLCSECNYCMLNCCKGCENYIT